MSAGLFMGTYLTAKSTGMWITKGKAPVEAEEHKDKRGTP